ncbi:SDR family NAD(P)-dependent oxidoreductase [Streptomyces sp. TLI_171]|uniref:SDR family NAD(P)-dependent oxidoreductase n=1 Tax=Streptomyces sp. TLI_171 TaxID=1938859 RepID=UPI000C191529|nr:SDR family oxidoreductase [Streptomyces sp. TLI_171]RKE17609.1 3-oxoacyl-[acyl-carrier protein] reductase [Streptomyces sp. TLI_171]
MTRTVLVTGGSSGIGRAVAARFAADGAQVYLTGRRPEAVERAAAELGAHGVVADATDPGAAAALAARLTTLDVLVNAAGGLPPTAPAGPCPLADLLASWQANLAQNLLGAVLTTEAVRELLAPGGAVISLGSLGAERRGGAYGAAKAALAAWSSALSAQLAPRGITCNVIAAGYIEGTDFFGGPVPEERRRALIEETHNKRPGTVDDIAATAHFLASPGARHLTGQTLHVNGGAHTTR